MIRKEKRMEIFKNRIVEIMVSCGGIAHLSKFYDALSGFKIFYKSEKSFRGAIRYLLESYSSEYEKVYNGIDVFSNVEKKSGYWCLAKDRHIQGIYSNLKTYLGRQKSILICKECLKNYA